MPYLGLGLHVLLALLCGVHAVRTGRPLYWLVILFSFPLLGSLIYFLAVYLPESRLERHAVRSVAAPLRRRARLRRVPTVRRCRVPPRSAA